LDFNKIETRLKTFFRYRVVRTQWEGESYFENMQRILAKNLRDYQPENMLDVGCGAGDNTSRIAAFLGIPTSRVWGIDYNDDCLLASSKKFKTEKIDLETDTLTVQNKSFDLVICNQVLEHLKNYQNVIDDIIRITRQDGYIVVGIPNLAHLINRIYMLFGRQPMCIDLNGPHVRSFTHRSFLDLLQSYGQTRVIDCTGSTMYPLPFYLARFCAHHFIGLSGYTCYLLQKVI
jgi:ubiquinone/menaquinone biosynthesis C-methylase UbiE